MTGLSRRDFLKLAGAGALGLGGAALGLNAYDNAQNHPKLVGKDIPPTWFEGKLPLQDVDVVNNPEYWVGESGEKLQKKLSESLYGEFKSIYPVLHKTVLEKDGYDMGEWQAEKMQRSFDKLLIDLADRGEDIVLAKAKNFNVQQDLQDRYYEMASYVQMLIGELGYKDQVGAEQFCSEIYGLVSSETIGQIGDTKLEQTIDRKKIDAIWNYDWQAFSKGLTVLSPVGLAYASPDGFELTYKPYLYNGDPHLSPDGIKPPINYGNEWYTKRPNKAEVLNFDPAVAIEIRNELRSVGIERGINQLTIVHTDHLQGVTRTGPDTSTVAIGYPQPETLTLEQYEARKREILKICEHEGFHSLSSRRTHLPSMDRMRLRSIENEVLASADPLADLQKVFNPDGDDHGYIEDNEYSITRYYIENVVNVYDNMGLSAKDVLNEFRGVISMMTNEDIFHTFWVLESDKDMDGLFTRLKADKDGYKGMTKYIAQTLLDNEEHILKRKRMTYPKEYDAHYFNDIVMPLVFAHLSLYKSSELAECALPENLDKDKGLVRNYMQTLHKRFRSFVKNGPSEEFLAEIFSEAMLTKKFGKHQVGFVNEALPKFEQILSLMRKNKLAVINNDSAV